MPKQIIVLDKQTNGNIRVAFWLTVPIPRQPFFIDSSNTSQWSGASTQENTDLQNGVFVEEIESYPADDLESNIAAAKTFLQGEYTAKQTAMDSVNNWAFYGSFYNGTDWTNGGVV